MKLNALSLAFATSITTAIAWLICSLLVWTMPGPMMTTTGHMVHMDMTRTVWMLTPLGFFGGLIVWSVLLGLLAWVLASLYNLFSRERPMSD